MTTLLSGARPSASARHGWYPPNRMARRMPRRRFEHLARPPANAEGSEFHSCGKGIPQREKPGPAAARLEGATRSDPGSAPAFGRLAVVRYDQRRFDLAEATPAPQIRVSPSRLCPAHREMT